MILQFSVSNYKCFRKLQTLNLVASSQDKSLPDNCIVTDLPGLAGKRWVKGVALYGANASGKTTMLEALVALGMMVENSARMTDPKEPIPQIEPFALAPGESESPTAFAVTFVAEGIRYEYRVAATRERIWHESLRAFPTTKEQAMVQPRLECGVRQLRMVAGAPDWISARHSTRRLHFKQHAVSFKGGGKQSFRT